MRINKKFSEDVKEYILSMSKERQKPVYKLANYLYQYKNFSLKRLQKEVEKLENIYIAENDKYGCQFEWLVEKDIGHWNNKKLSEIALLNGETQEEMNLMYKMICSSITAADAISLIKNNRKECGFIDNRNNYCTILRFFTFGWNLLEDTKEAKDSLKRLSRIVKCEIIKEALKQDLLINSRSALDYYTVNKATFELDENGYLYIKPLENPYYDLIPPRHLVFTSIPDEEKEWLNNAPISQMKVYHRSVDLQIYELKSGLEIAIRDSFETSVNIYKGTASYYLGSCTDSTIINIKGACEEIYVQQTKSSSSVKNMRPLTIAHIVGLKNKYYDVKEFGEKLDQFLDLLQGIHHNPFIKEIKALINSNIKVPFRVDSLMTSHNWQEFFENNYKVARIHKVKFNKLGLVRGYLFVKYAKYVEGQDYNTLLSFIKTFNEENAKRLLTAYDSPLNRFFYNKVLYSPSGMMSNYDYEKEAVIADWIKMSIKANKKISLRRSSYSKIKEDHDELYLAEMEKASKKIADNIIIAKKSKFNNLRKHLPEEFEWIRTSRRLFMESKIQHHCVYTYEDYVKRDISTIYSFVVPETGNRHTIEFKTDSDGNYFVAQIQKKYDRGYDAELIPYLEKALKKYPKALDHYKNGKILPWVDGNAANEEEPFAVAF